MIRSGTNGRHLSYTRIIGYLLVFLLVQVRAPYYVLMLETIGVLNKHLI